MSSETLDTLPRARAAGPAEALPERPRRIGRYRVVGMLGSGGMGVVYEGIDDVLWRRVAIKQLLRAGARVLREAQALARLAHPNVVAVYEIVEAEGEVFIVMERVEGWTLTTWLDERAPSRQARLEALVQAGCGVAAAHAVGLIHRDLKPQNIMVGLDGRVRVMDFGLARTIDASEWDLELDADRPDAAGGLAAPLTGTGERLGTRGYMAPEQYQGRPVDERTDVFGFSVVAYEVLHGRRLFEGGDAEVMHATLSGRSDPPPRSDVPAWLDAVIRRGLGVDPDARWATMSALLEALARDPSARWRRMARGIAALVLAIAIATGAALGYLALAEQWAQERGEELASERLAAVEAAIARAEAMGDRQAAEAAFRAFVLDPAHQGTRALSHAWLHRGARLRDDPEAAKSAYAEAYSLAHDPDDAIAALREMAAVFHATWDGPALGQAVALLRARGVENPELDELAFDAALWQRDLPGAIAAMDASEPRASWRPMIEQLGRVRSNEDAVVGLSVLPPGLPARVAIRGRDPHEVMLLDEQLVVVERLGIQGRALHLVPETPWAVVERDGEIVLHDLLTGGEQIWRGPSPTSVSSAVAFDLRGDAAPELLFSRAWPALGLRAIDPRGGPEWIPHAGTDAVDSTIESFAVADLDGDGIDELIAAFGPWHAFDLRVFHRGENGSLELLARHALGRTAALAVVRRGDQRLLAAITDDACPAPERFPEPPHTGAPAGVHLLSWAGGELREVDFVPLPRERGLARFDAGPFRGVGDFDGDGREDLAFNLLFDPRQNPGTGRRGPWLLLLRQTDDGFEPLHVADLSLWGAAQLDDDAALELLASPPDFSLLALGAGDRALPASSPPHATAHPLSPEIDDPLLVERWQRAEDLVALGLPTIAAASLRDAEPLARDHHVQLAMLERAAELFFTGEAMEQSLAIDRRVREDPVFAANALERSARALARLGRHAEALTDAEALLASPHRSQQQDELARALARDLTALVSTHARVDLRFDIPLEHAWVHHTPGALRRDPARSTLALTVPARPEPVAELPLDWDGGPFSLELDLEVERLEHGACMRVALTDEADVAWLGGGLCTDGGGGGLRQTATALDDGQWAVTLPQVVHSGLHRRRVLIRMAYFPGRELVDFVLVDGESSTLLSVEPNAPQPGRQRLMIGAFVSGVPPALGIGALHRVSIRGAHLAAPAPELVARDEPVRLLAENEPLAALAALDRARVTHPRAEQVRLLAHAQLYDLEGLARVAPALLPHLHDPAWLGDFALDLRAQPLAAAALRSAAGPAILPLLREAWDVMGTHRNDPEMHNLVLEQLLGIEALRPTTVEERGALRRLLYLRGRMWIQADVPMAGRRDFEAAASLPAFGELPDLERDTWSQAHLALARLAHEDRVGARRHLQQALCIAAWPDELRAISSNDPALAPLLDSTSCETP